MKVLLVSHYFPPEIGAPQARLSELARFWAEAGLEVTVLTGMPNHPTGVIPAEYRKRIRCDERVDGYRVVRTWLYATPNEGLVKKTLGHLSFMATSVVLGWRTVGRPDVVVVSSPTFFSIFSAWFLAKAKRARLVVEIRDLWPAIFVELGVLRNKPLIWALERIEMAFYRSADHVVPVTEGFRDNLIERGVPASKITTITNGVDLDRFQPADSDPQIRHRLGAAEGDTLVLYLGAHGISHGLSSVADAAALLQDEPIHVAFVGEGAAKRQLEQHVQALGCRNVTLLPGVPREDVPAIIAAADLCLVPLRDVPLFSTFIPSKIFEYLGSAKAVRGEPATILRNAGCPVVEPEDAAALARAIRALAADPSGRAALGVRGRAFVADRFDRRRLAERYRSVLETLAGRS
jgi:glycosyltransferase involved in cell wall biosynthesis